MRFRDLLYLSLKCSKSKWAAFMAAFMAAGVFCLCFAGVALITIQQEKSQPFELIVSAENAAGITDTILAGIVGTHGVEAATPIVQMPVKIQMGGYSAELTLTGIKPSYLNNDALPESSVMPYIIMNEAACKLFKKPGEKANTDKAPDIDWMNTSALISMGEESAGVTSRVCAILESGKGDKAMAYISLNAAKALFKTSGTAAIYPLAHVRIKNIGCAEEVSKLLSALRLKAENADTKLQTRWDSWTTQMTYLFILGVIPLLCSGVVLFAWRRISFLEQKETHETLYFAGMNGGSIARIFTLQAMCSSLVGAGYGILVTMVLPYFLPQDLSDNSVFMLRAPATVMLICGALKFKIRTSEVHKY